MQRLKKTSGEVSTTMAEEADRDQAQHRYRDNSAEPDHLEVRDGDTLVVNYAGAKLSIAAYSTVELDGAIYTRKLRAGDDPVEEYARVYAYLRRESLGRARAKLAEFADELSKAKRRAAGASGAE